MQRRFPTGVEFYKEILQLGEDSSSLIGTGVKDQISDITLFKFVLQISVA